ncbi:acyltransferase family protein [Mesobacterium pallidum]|uniref:acyltransferase family protein n=1 Tax=Mesobacterium pallidum TaxID=2872037 RepID=UPI001EE16C1F|nr:acyltransferase family protein [Mesobacterium pallidum]
MKYRPEIDGLRALAVLPVILFHAGLLGVPGGFLGVDVFFVVSGFLITGILARELDAGDFSIARFYERRARRILPALVVVILATLPFAWAWMQPARLADLGRSLVGVATFTSNIQFWSGTGYFNTSAELKPMLHTWSLAVEEQFYILYPPLLWLIWKRNVALVLALIAVASLAAAIWTVGHAQSTAFYWLHTRAWELMAGALAALWLRRLAAPSGSVAQAGSLLGLAAICAAMVVFDETTPTPGAWTLVPVLGTVAVLLCAQPGTLVHKLLTLRVFVGIGLISYSAYLWHQPVFALARLRLMDAPSLPVMLGLSALSLALAGLTWWLVEQPFRTGAFRSLPQKRLFRASALVLGATCVAGMVSLRADGFPDRAPVAARVEAVTTGWEDRDPCYILADDLGAGESIAARVRACQPGPDSVLMIGDSHAGAMSKAMRAVLASHGRRLITLSNLGCYPVPGVTQEPDTPSCAGFRAALDDVIATTDAPVVLTARWRLYLTGQPYDNGEGGVDGAYHLDIAVAEGPPMSLDAHLGLTLARWAEARDVIVIDQIPEPGWDVPSRIFKRDRFTDDRTPVTTDLARRRAANAPLDALLDAAETLPRLSVLRTGPLVCSEATGRCAAEDNGQPLYRDDNHPSPAFATRIAEALIPLLPAPR